MKQIQCGWFSLFTLAAVAVSVETAAVEVDKKVAEASGLGLRNGWFVHNNRVVWGYAQHNGWWGGYRGGGGFWVNYRVRTNITRNAPGRVGPGWTEDLDRLTDNMLRYGYPGFEHNFGLWYDRRRDGHDMGQRGNAAVVSPYLEQPWARSRMDVAWDGLPKYDLSRYNPWYFTRLGKFAELCDRKGTILFHNFYMQHALLETNAHYVDFPWRPTNCVQKTEMPDSTPAATAFYDVSHPLRRSLHRAYIRHCLDRLGKYSNVVHLPCQEYTGSAEFLRFWLDTIAEWERERSVKVKVGLGATKDVLDEILADPIRGPMVSVIDLRYWWYKADGSLLAPEGGKEVPGRYASGFDIAAQSSPWQVYLQVREYRERYPEKAIIHTIDATRQMTWAFLMAGGSMLIRRMEYPDTEGPTPWTPPEAYIAPKDSAIIQPAYEFINTHLASELPEMLPRDRVPENPKQNWCLGQKDRGYLAYLSQGGPVLLDLSEASGVFRARWLNPRSGEVADANPAMVEAGKALRYVAPDEKDWVLWLKKTGND